MCGRPDKPQLQADDYKPLLGETCGYMKRAVFVGSE